MTERWTTPPPEQVDMAPATQSAKRDHARRASVPSRLKEVVATVPEACRVRSNLTASCYALRSVLLFAASMWGLFVTTQPLAWLPLWLFAGLSITGMFVLAHDAAHGTLFASPRANRLVGTLLMLPSLHAFQSWVVGHNWVHHGHPIKKDMDFAWHPVDPNTYRDWPSLRRARHRLEWSCIGAGIYYFRNVYWNQVVLAKPPRSVAAPIQRDRLLVLVYFLFFSAATILIGGVPLWLRLMVVPWMIWNYCMGALTYLHHVHPEIIWHESSSWTKTVGQFAGATVYVVPRWLNIFLHNIMLHVPHHVDARIPFYHLPRAVAALHAEFGEQVRIRRLDLRQYLAITSRCKLYAFDQGRWEAYDGELTA